MYTAEKIIGALGELGATGLTSSQIVKLFEALSKDESKKGITTPVKHDLELLEKLWGKRNPAHERQMHTGVDLFWGTAACVFDDYIKALNQQ